MGSPQQFRVVRESIEDVPLPAYPECRVLTRETMWSGDKKPGSMILNDLAIQAIYEASLSVTEQTLTVEERCRAHIGRIALPWHTYRLEDQIFI
jgi:hypothetical protein